MATGAAAPSTRGEWSAAAKGGAGSAILSDEADIAAMPSGWQEEADEHIEALQQTLQQLQSEVGTTLKMQWMAMSSQQPAGMCIN